MRFYLWLFVLSVIMASITKLVSFLKLAKVRKQTKKTFKYRLSSTEQTRVYPLWG